MTETQKLLSQLGQGVRERRHSLGWTLPALAKASGVCERYLSSLERGLGNISVGRLAQVAWALGTTPKALIPDLPGPAGPQHLVLLGLRGAGKSCLGQALAEATGRPFIELDREIEALAGLSVAQIFELHGEAAYRRYESKALDALLASDAPSVVAAGGGLVTEETTFRRLLVHCDTVWLQASAQSLWDRVIAQGDKRPMSDNPNARAELEALIEARAPLYARADHSLDTDALGELGALERLQSLVR